MANNRHWGVRAFASLIIFAIAALLTPVALVGHWGHRTVIDGERYIETVGPLIENPAVQQAVADAVSTAIIDQVDTKELTQQLLGKVIGNDTLSNLLAAPIAAGVNNLIRDLTLQLVASDAFATIWKDTNRIAQQSLVRLLEGDPEGIVQIQGEDIVLDISNLATGVQKQLVDRGFTAAGNVTIPQIDRQVVLASSAALPQLQFIYRLSSPILQWFPLFLALLFGLAVALARNRGRTVLAVGIALFAMTLLTRIGLNVGEGVFVDQLQNTVFAPASTVFWSTFFNYLVIGLDAVILLGVLIAVAGWFSGGSRLAVRARTSSGDLLHRVGDGIPASVRRPVRQVNPILRWAIVIVMVVILGLQPTIDTWAVIWVTLLTVVLFAVLEALSGPDRLDGPAESAGPVDGISVAAGA